MCIQTYFICFSLLNKNYEVLKNIKFGGILIIYIYIFHDEIKYEKIIIFIYIFKFLVFFGFQTELGLRLSFILVG